MARLEYFVVCEGISVDQRTNNISLFGVSETIRAATFPGVIPQLFAVSTWNAEPGDEERDFQATLSVHMNNARLNEWRHNFRFEGRRARLIGALQGTQVPGPGELRFDIALNGDHGASHTIEIHQLDEAAGDPE